MAFLVFLGSFVYSHVNMWLWCMEYFKAKTNEQITEGGD